MVLRKLSDMRAARRPAEPKRPLRSRFGLRIRDMGTWPPARKTPAALAKYLKYR
jgi:hypothetical protein